MVVDEQQVLNTFVKYFAEANIVMGRQQWSFDNQGRLNIKGHVTVRKEYTVAQGGTGLPNGRLPLRFGRVHGDFNVSGCELTTLKGCPLHVGGLCFVSNNPIPSLEGAPQLVDYLFVMQDLTQLTSLEGFPAQIEICRFDWRHNLPLLRLLQAKKLILGNPGPSHSSPANRCFEILKGYAGQGEAGAFTCGAELADAGYKENARW